MRWYCCTCGRSFGSSHALGQHKAALGHTESFSWFGCSFCPVSGLPEGEIKQHEAEDHLWCSDCEREFYSYSEIKTHLRSRAHRGKSTPCPFCESPYTTVAGVTCHLENGCCPAAQHLNPDKLFGRIRARDSSGLITNQLIEWHGSMVHHATEHTWNGRYYKCYLCHRQFNALDSLNQHIRSPAHPQKPYHCPNRAICKKQFVSLAGLFSHLESESCGYTRFERVQQGFQEGVTGKRLIAF
ncbi:hypothetical protein F5X98DRAFT_335181 [Xylaria grammica]|nr:hypothetical protein F5X98DRAFT_335181 [Xylaria grammica]